MVIDHLAKPRIRDAVGIDADGWRANLAACAQRPNVYCKLSGMVTEADHGRWTADQLLVRASPPPPPPPPSRS